MSINQTLPNIYRSPDPKLSHFLLSVVNREDAARPRSGNTRSEFLLWTQKWIMWEVVCPVHGLHHVNQKTEPIVCKIKVQRIAPLYPSYPSMRETARERSSDFDEKKLTDFLPPKEFQSATFVK